MRKRGIQGILTLTMLSQCLISISQTDILDRTSTLHQAGICDEEGYCIPSLQGLPRSKGISLNYTSIRNQDIITEYNNETFSGLIEGTSKFEVKAKIPLLLRSNLKIVLGADYSTYDFEFAEHHADQNRIFESLNNITYRTFETKLYLMKPFLGNKYIFSRLSVEFTGDLLSKGIDDYFRSTFSILYGIRSSTRMTWGIGLNYRSSLGRHLVFPTFAYSQILSKRWSLEAYLPMHLNLRYMPNSKNIFEFRNQLAREHLNTNPGITDDNNIILAKTDYYSTIAYEREVHDFLWISLATGYQVNFDFASSIKRNEPVNSSSLVKNDLTTALVFEIGIFIVPPKKWID